MGWRTCAGGPSWSPARQQRQGQRRGHQDDQERDRCYCQAAAGQAAYGATASGARGDRPGESRHPLPRLRQPGARLAAGRRRPGVRIRERTQVRAAEDDWAREVIDSGYGKDDLG